MMDYIRILLSIIFAITVMYMLLDCEIKHRNERYLLGLYITIIIILNVFVIYNYGYNHFMKLFPFLVHLPIFIAFVLISKFKIAKVFFVHWTLVALIPSLSMLSLSISYFLGNGRETANIVFYVLYLPAWFIIYKYIRTSFLYILRNTDKGWLGFSIIPLSYSVFIYSNGMYNPDVVIENFNFLNTVLLFVIGFSSYLLIIRFFKQMQKFLNLQSEQNLLITQVAAAQLHLEALKESQEKTLIYRHDMRHHLDIISAYLADNNKAEVQKYITEVEKNIENATVKKYCNNYSVNLILYSYIAKARDEQIRVETQMDLPEKTTISDMDLCVFFANALENAIIACKSMRINNERVITIVSKNNNKKIYIQITNSFDGTVVFVDDMPVSTKENHGLGTKSIAAVAQKYDGVYSFTAENGIFKTSIIL